MELNPHISAGIRSALNELWAIDESHNLTEFWHMELHGVSGYPIPDRWNAMTLRQIQRDVESVKNSQTQP